MSLTLHTVSGAPRGWRVLMGMAFKGLDPDIRFLNFSEKEHLQPEFISLNSRATVPVLETGTAILRDSIAILAWLDREYPEKPLFGVTPAQAGEIWQLTMESCDYLRDANNRFLGPIFFGNGSIPASDSAERSQLQSAAELVHAECRYLEDILSDGRLFLCGDDPSAADAVIYPEIRLIQRAVETKPEILSALGFVDPAELYLKLSDWRVRLNNNPSIVGTLPPHWGQAAAQRASA